MYKASSKKKWLSLVFFIFLIFPSIVSLVPGTALADDGPKQSGSPYETIFTDENGNQITEAIFPLPPPKIKMAVANVPDVHIAGAINTLSNVPAFDWSYGCSATSAAMLFGYYDRNSYNSMYTGATNGGVCPLDNSVWGHTTYPGVVCGELPLSATHNGIDGRAIKGHVDDYWIDAGNAGPDPYLGNWAEHTLGDCTGDYMGTNQAKYSNTDGSTKFYWYSSGDPLYDFTDLEPTYRDGCHGMRLFAESRGYTVVTNFSQAIKGQGSDPDKGFTFADFQAEIDAGRPVLIQVTGHTMLGYGYDTSGDIIYIHDTWDYSPHTMTWGGTYSLSFLQHEGVTVIQLQAIPPTVTNDSGASNIAQTSARLNGEVTSTGWENPTVHIYWGLSDGGTAPGSWAHDVNLGIKAAGTFYTDISGLTVGTPYYYRCYAVNSEGGSWAASTASFTTSTPPTMETIAEAEGQYYNTAPVLSNFGFDDNNALDDGWYQMDSFSGNWTALFTDFGGTSWDSDNWTVPGFVGLGEGTHIIYFKATDDTGNVEGESGEWGWQFYKDTGIPNDPTGVGSTSHTASTWSSDNTVDISWTDATDVTSGLDGYSILWNTDNSTVPDAVKDIEEGSGNTTSSALADGSSHYFHIRSVDNAGNWQSTVHLGPFYIDTTPPTDPTSINSTSHSLSVWSSDNTTNITWTDATDNLSGLDGYSILWNTDNSTVPDAVKDIEEGSGNTTSNDLVDGNNHYLHIRSVDNVGNWQSTVHFGPFYIAVNAPFLSNGTVSQNSGYTSANFTFSVNYTDFENDAPVSITITTDNTTTANMTEQDSLDFDFTDGKIYEYSILGSSLGLGSHFFQFAANDGTDNAIGDIDSHSGPTVSSPPSGGGGGGGGGGGAGITPVRPYLRDNKFTEDVSAKSEDYKVELFIPEGTVATNAIGASISSIRIQPMAELPLRPKDTSTVAIVYEMGPAGAIFNPPVDLIMEYDESKIPEGVAEKTLVLSFYDDDTGQWTDLESTVDTENNTVTAKVSHFSAFTVLAYTRPASFTVADLSIIPDEIEIGEPLNISVLVTNDGNLSGSYEVSLKMDDLPVQTKEVTLAGGDAETVGFSTTPDTAGEHIIDVCGVKGTCTVVKSETPATFSASDLTISPAELLTGGGVTIGITLTNTGDLTGTHEVILEIDGSQVETKTITLNGGESQQMVFTNVQDIVGAHSVDIEGLSDKFEVQELAPVPAEEEKVVMPAPAATSALEPSPEPVPAQQVSRWIMAGIITGILLIGLASYYFIKKKRKTV